MQVRVVAPYGRGLAGAHHLDLGACSGVSPMQCFVRSMSFVSTSASGRKRSLTRIYVPKGSPSG